MERFQCIFCDNFLDTDTTPEHVLLDCLGGRKASRRIICTFHNNFFGGEIDWALGEQTAQLRNLFQVNSGSGDLPPQVVVETHDGIKLKIYPNGMPEVLAKPFSVESIGDKRLININVGSSKLGQLLPHIAAAGRVEESELIKRIAAEKPILITSRPRIAFNFGFGGVEALRSIVKSALSLWALTVGNDEVKSDAYKEARDFVMTGNMSFMEPHTCLDNRSVPQSAKLEAEFSHIYNLIYVGSNETGEVLGHFCLFNIISWTFRLAKDGGARTQAATLISNPLDNKIWSIDSDRIGGSIPFGWLASPTWRTDEARDTAMYADRINKAMSIWHRDEPKRAAERITNEVFKRELSLGNDDMTPQIASEIAERFAHHIMDVPYKKPLTESDMRALRKAAKIKSGKDQ